MSVTGVAANMLFQAVAASAARKSHGNFAQVHSEVQQLGQDLQAGNLAGAQQDFAALAQNFPAAADADTGFERDAGCNHRLDEHRLDKHCLN